MPFPSSTTAKGFRKTVFRGVSSPVTSRQRSGTSSRATFLVIKNSPFSFILEHLQAVLSYRYFIFITPFSGVRTVQCGPRSDTHGVAYHVEDREHAGKQPFHSEHGWQLLIGSSYGITLLNEWSTECLIA